MEIDFNSFDDKYNEYENRFIDLTKIALDIIGLNFDPIISISLVNNDFIHQINKEYRNIDKETDVISFAFIDSEKDKNTILRSGKSYVLGDIYISVEKAITQAKEIGNTLQREILFLYVHGLLHLLGYDHMKKEDEEKMFALQEDILQAYIRKKI